jgi:chitodextrinase
MNPFFSKSKQGSLQFLVNQSFIKFLFFFLFSFGLNQVLSAQNQTFYVTENGGGTFDGSSWANASNDLQLMINNSSAGDVIFVAEGTYKPIRPANNLSTIDNDNRDNAFVLKSGVKIYGGFAGSENSLSERELGNHETILSGDIGSVGDETDNSYHVVVAVNVDDEAVIDGFTITGGSPPPSVTSTITVNGETVSRSAGAGICNISSNPNISNTIISGNSSIQGGGIFNSSSSPNISNTIISGNSSTQGGGIFNSSSSPNISNTIISGNRGVLGGGIFNSSSSPNISNTIISGNRGGLGGGIFNSLSSSNISNTIISGNISNSGGGVIFNSSSSTINNSIVQGGFSGCNNCPNGNGNADPLFVDMPDANDAPFTNGDFNLMMGSPAIDAGDNSLIPVGITTDILGNPRIQNGTVNLGAYETIFEPISLRYVTENGTGDGSSWANASSDLQLMINNSLEGDTIFVAEGTYKPIRPANNLSTIDIDNRDNAFVLKSGVKIYGGFAGTENSLSERELGNYETILSGDIGIEGDDSDNCYHVVFAIGVNDETEFNGFTITKGYAVGDSFISIDGSNILSRWGGGIYCNNANFKIKNAIITENIARHGGAIYGTSSSIEFINTLISQNSALHRGVLNFQSSSNISFINSTITKNSAPSSSSLIISVSGGGINVYNSIVWGNTGGLLNSPNNTDIKNSIIEGGFNNCNNCPNGDGNLDPLFSDLSNGDYSLQCNSLAINAGDNALISEAVATDLSGNDRVKFGIIDLGAFEAEKVLKFTQYPKDTILTIKQSVVFETELLTSEQITSYQWQVSTDGGETFSDISGALSGTLTLENLNITQSKNQYRLVTQSTDCFVEAVMEPAVLLVNGTRYVTGIGNADGSSWTSASRDLQLMINNSIPGDTIFINQGTFKPLRPASDLNTVDENNRDNAFVLKSGVKIFGGFGGGEGSLADRPLGMYETILSGDIGVEGDNSDNCYHVVIASNVDDVAEINGVTISDGNADGTFFLTLNELPVFRGDGGGIYINTGSLKITNVIVSGNSAENKGGGIFNRGNSSHLLSPQIVNTLIIGNFARNGGGGILNDQESPSLINTAIIGNNALGGGRGGEFRGGLFNESSTPIIKNSIIWGNNGNGLNGSTISNSIVQDGFSACNDCPEGDGNADPLFMDLPNFNDAPFTNGDFRLRCNSPALKAGNNSFFPNDLTKDLLGEERIKNGTIDLGPFESEFFLFFTLNPSDTAIIVTQNASFEFETTTNSSPVNYQWQLSTDGGDTFTDIQNQVNNILNLENIDISLANNQYRVVADAQGCPAEVNSEVALLTVNGTRYVTQNGTGDGSSWANASGDLQLMINNSIAGDTIFVAEGTYKPIRPANDLDTIDNDNRDNAFVLKSGVKIYGGFAGNENSLDERQLGANETILSGDIGTIGDNSDNCYHVVIASNVDDVAEINGVTITGGNANLGRTTPILVDGNEFSKEVGGGIYNINSSPLISNVKISGNSALAAGGILNEASSPKIVNSLVIGNFASSSVGGIWNIDSSPMIINTSIAGNNTDLGDFGDVSNISSSPTISNSIIWGNQNNNLNGSTISNSIVQGGFSACNNCPEGDGNVDPLFIDLPDFNDAPFTNGDFKLRCNSPALKAGNNAFIPSDLTKDLLGEERIKNGTIDLGPFEADYFLFFTTNPNDTTGVVSQNVAFEFETNTNTSPVNYQWQLSTDGGDTFTDIQNQANGILNLENIDISLANNQYRVVANAQDCPAEVNSEAALLTVNGTRYVTENGVGDGSSWANASGDLQLMINNSIAGDTIFVAEGTYKPIRPANDLGTIDNDNRDNAFVLKSGVKIYGGFVGNENSLDERQLGANETILSGDIGIEGDNSDNCYHIVVAVGVDDEAEINGFTITEGNANGSGSLSAFGTFLQQNRGGGMLISSTSAIFSNIIVLNNTALEAGGGVYTSSAAPNFSEIIIRGNSAGFAGGLYNLGSTGYEIRNSFFESNTITAGGVSIVHNANSEEINFINTIFSGNSVQEGILIFNLNTSSVFTNCVFSGNLTSPNVAIVLDDRGRRFNLTFNNSIIWGNNSSSVITPAGRLAINNSIIEGGFNNCNNCPNGNGDMDPLFMDLTDFNDAPFSGGDFRLQCLSLGSFAGDVNSVPANVITDILGEPRITNNQVSIGAYQNPVQPLPLTENLVGGQFCGGDQVTLVAQEFPSNPTYKWFKDGVLFDELSGSTLSFIANNASDGGLFKVEITASACEPLETNEVNINVTNRDNGVNQRIEVLLGETLEIPVTDPNATNVSWEYRTDSRADFVPLAGAVGSPLIINNAGLNEIGQYRATYLNSANEVVCTGIITVMVISPDFFIGKWIIDDVNIIPTITATSNNEVLYFIEIEENKIFRETLDFGVESLTELDYNATDSLVLYMMGTNIEMLRPRNQFRELKQWGSAEWTNVIDMFRGVPNLVLNTESAPNLSNVTVIDGMFREATNFNSSVSHWDVSGVESFDFLFSNTSFNQNLEDWVVESGTSFRFTFANNADFNQDISGWSMQNAETLQSMFSNATAFDQNLSSWELNSLSSAFGMLNNSGLSCENYSAFLISLGNNQNIASNVFLGAETLVYNNEANQAREMLIANKSWNFTGDSPNLISFITQPESAEVCLGTSITFVSEAVGSNLSYQWFFKGEPIAGELNSSLSLNNLNADNLGEYFVQVTNDCNTINSDTVSLTIPNLVVTQPESQALCLDESTVLTAEAGSPNVTYQWFFEGNEITGELNNTLLIEDFEPSKVGSYFVRVNGICGSVDSEPAMLSFREFSPQIFSTAQLPINISGEAVPTAGLVFAGLNDESCFMPNELDFEFSPSIFSCQELGQTINTQIIITTPTGQEVIAFSNITIVDNLAPTAVLNNNITLALNDDGNAQLTEALVDAGSFDNCSGTDLIFEFIPAVFTCNNLGLNSVTVNISDQNGNTRTREIQVTVEDNIAPVLNVLSQITLPLNTNGEAILSRELIDEGTTDNCTLSESLVFDFSETEFSCVDLNTNILVDLVVSDLQGNQSQTTIEVNVVDELAPEVIAQNAILVLDESGQAILTPQQVIDSSSDNCTAAEDLIFELSQTEFNCAQAGTTVSVTLTIIDESSNQTQETVEISVVETVDPITNAVASLTVELDENGFASITPEMVNDGSTDNCTEDEDLQLALDIFEFDCSNLGSPVTVTLTVTDLSGNASSAQTEIIVIDTVDPIANAVASLTVELDENGSASITPEMVNDGSTDNCTEDEDLQLALDIFEFDCSNLGSPVTVTLTVTDLSGNFSTAQTEIIVIDTVEPIANAGASLTVELDENGFASITPEMLNEGSTDNCTEDEDLQLSLDILEFDCSNLGSPVMVTLTVTDASGNFSTAQTEIIVIDTVEPIANAVASLTVELDENGFASITPEMVNDGSTDNCTEEEDLQLALDIFEFDCSNLGSPVMVTLTVTDASGNFSTAQTEIIVIDTVEPIANAVASLTVELDENGFASITSEMVNDGSTDNCTEDEDLQLALDIFDFDCSNLGSPVTVTLTVTDLSGNASSVQTEIIVIDTVEPFANAVASLTVELDENGFASITPEMINDGSTDNCTEDEDLQLALDIFEFDCSNLGSPVTVTLTVTDASGNFSTTQSEITVMDSVEPFANAVASLTVELDENGFASITPEMVNDGSTDNCTEEEDLQLALDIFEFDCSNLGSPVTVTLTVTDLSGNFSTAQSEITVMDLVEPFANAVASLTVELDENCFASITPEMVNDGSTDNCTEDEDLQLALDIFEFDCSNLGSPVTVTLTVTDLSGNASSVQTEIIVIDTVEPFANAVTSLTVDLDENGFASITPEMVNDGSTDNCTEDEDLQLALDIFEFDCSNLGSPVTVTLTVTDLSGNASSVQTEIIVIDTVEPFANAVTSLTVDLDENGFASITPEMVNDGSTDNCTEDEDLQLALDIFEFDCSNLGSPVTVTLTVTDLSGNASSAQTEIIVIDTVDPIANAVASLTVELDENGFASITPEMVNDGSTDNCTEEEDLQLALDIFEFDCSNLGSPVAVTLTVTDASGNFSTAQSEITVIDSVEPIANAVTSLTVELDENGFASITSEMVNDGSTDNCTEDEDLQLALDIFDFDCSNLGSPVAVTLTVTDLSGNFSTAQSEITVIDSVEPIANAVTSLTVELDENGFASITSEMVNDGSTDNCTEDEDLQLALDIFDFDCSNLGSPVTVTLTVTDLSGNASSAQTEIIVIDTVEPIANAVASLTVELDENGFASITPEMVNDGSTDNCTEEEDLQLALDIFEFDCSNLGSPVTVTLIVTDLSGNASSAQIAITVIDNSLPNLLINESVTLFLNEQGVATLSSDEVDAGSSDLCAGSENLTFSFSISEFSCEDLGSTQEVEVFLSDASENTVSGFVLVSVEDTLAPVINADDQITLLLSANGTATLPLNAFYSSVSDNCTPISELTFGLTRSSFSCNDIDLPVNVTLFVTDAQGNTAEKEILIIVEDVTAPVFAPISNVVIEANTENCAANIELEALATDVCSNVVIISNNAPEIFPLGTTEVVWTAEDESGNIATAIQLVEVVVSPFASLPDDESICGPNEITLEALGAETVIWDNEFENGQMVLVSETTVFTGVAINSLGCEQELSWLVTVIALPESTVTYNEQIQQVETDSFDSYQWFFEGEAIPGAIFRVHPTITEGDYTVLVSENECEAESDVFTLLLVDISEQISNETHTIDFSVFPNPSKGDTWINFTGDLTQQVDLQVVDLTGKILATTRLNKEKMQLELNHLAEGVYFIRVLMADESLTKRLIIKK